MGFLVHLYGGTSVTASITLVGNTPLSAAINAQEGLPGRKRPEDVLSPLQSRRT